MWLSNTVFFSYLVHGVRGDLSLSRTYKESEALYSSLLDNNDEFDRPGQERGALREKDMGHFSQTFCCGSDQILIDNTLRSDRGY